jgi:outer membrane receptor protein involved in Fe transport
MKFFEPMRFRQRIFSEGIMGGQLIVLGLLLAAAISAVVPLNARAQTETGQIVGNVTDPNGAVVSGAKIKIVNVGTGAERLATSDTQGSYVATNLLPAVYEITVEAAGFSVNKTRAQVTVGSRVTADFQLVVGGTQQVVEVVAGAGVQVNTETQTVAEVIDGKKLSELPTVSRNPYAFVITAGNVSPGDPSGRGAGVSINGQRAAGTNILLDGAANNDEFVAGIGQTVPLDAVQEYSIITNNFTAEFGRASGGIVNVATKAGTNNYHGTAYEFGRYSRLNSNSFQNNANVQPKNVYTRNQFGYSIGGPVIKEKILFFQSTEFLRVRSNNTQFVVVPTSQFLALTAPATQNFFNQFGALKPGATALRTITRQDLINAGSDPCGPGSVCASMVAPSTPIFTRLAYDVPANSGGGDPQNTYYVVGRVDYNLSDKTQIYGRYSLDRSRLFDGSNSNSPYVGFDSGTQTNNNSFVISATHTFSPRLVLQSKGVFNRLNTSQPLNGAPSPTLYWRDIGTTRFLGDLAALPGYLPFSPGLAIPFGGPQNFLQTYQDLNYTLGKHNFRFGGSYVYIQDNRTFGAYQNPSSGLSQSTVAIAMNNILMGQLARFQGAINPQGKFPCRNPAAPDPSCTIALPVQSPNFSRSNLYNEFAFYGQDSWRFSPRLTLNLGLRYEYFGVQHNKNKALDSNYYDSNDSNPALAIRNGNVATGQRLWDKDLNNFAPRLGFAWDVFGDGKTSLRGGYGISYERNFGNVTFNIIQNPPNYAVISVNNTPITTSVAGPLAGTSGSAVLPPVQLRNVDSKIRTAYAQFFSVSLERELARNLVVALDYNGSLGRKLYSIENPNRVGHGTVLLGDPLDPSVNGGAGSRLRTSQFTNINRRGDNAFSNYNAFNLRVNINNFRSSGLQLTTNYTYSHAIDNLSTTFSDGQNGSFGLGLLDPFNPDLDRGNADFDIRQRFVVSGVWDIPFAKETKGIKKQVLDGWELAPIFTAQTGTPFTIFDCTNGITVCARVFQTGALPRKGADDPAQDPNTPGTFTYMSVAGLFDSTVVNPLTGTTEVGPFAPNMIGRNFHRGPGSWNADLGVYKNFQLTERFKLQFRSEFYNMFNHANSAVLLTETDVSSQSVVRTQKDGNRNVQMALKLIF